MKMYIVLLDNFPIHMAPLIAAHASLCGYLMFEKDLDMQKWKDTSFKKVVCITNENHFEKLKKLEKYFIVTESSLAGKEVALVFCPREEVPKQLRRLRLWNFLGERVFISS
jgi:hypothetical protein